VVGEEERLDPISTEMASSPLSDAHGMPGQVLLGFMAGAVVVRRSAYLVVGGYDPRFFIGGEEETLSLRLAKQRGQCGEAEAVRSAEHLVERVAAPSLVSALRWTAFGLADGPKNSDWTRGVAMALRGFLIVGDMPNGDRAVDAARLGTADPLAVVGSRRTYCGEEHHERDGGEGRRSR
jgi:hypothetical protein